MDNQEGDYSNPNYPCDKRLVVLLHILYYLFCRIMFVRLCRLYNPAGGGVNGATGCTSFIAEGSGDRREPVPEALRLDQRKLLHQVGDTIQLVLDIGKRSYLLFSLFQIESASVVGVELLYQYTLGVAILEVLVVIQVTVVCRHCIEITHINSLGGFFLGEEGFVHLLAMTDSNHADFRSIGRLVLEQLDDGLGLGLDGACGCFLDQDVAILAVLEGEEDKIDGLLQTHDEAGHGGLGDGDGVALADLVYPQGDDAAAAAHDVAIAGAADLGVATHTALGHGNLLFDGLCDSHGVDGVSGLVGGEADDALDAGIDGGIEGVVGADDVGLDGLHGEELAAGHLLEGGGMEDVVHALHGVAEGAAVAHIANVELDLAGHLGHTGLEVVTHIVLLLLVA